MAEPRELLEEFRARFEAGDDPDPRELLERVEGERRQELHSLIDNYLMTAPRRSWDPVAYEASPAKAAVDRVYESLEGVSGTWPELLPALRNRARIKRSELVQRLADALGVGDRAERVGDYYNRMEHGRLPAEGVSGRVIEALAGIVGASAEAIREAGAATGETAGPDVLYARKTMLHDADFAAEEVASPAASSLPPDGDEVDELFTGG